MNTPVRSTRFAVAALAALVFALCVSPAHAVMRGRPTIVNNHLRADNGAPLRGTPIYFNLKVKDRMALFESTWRTYFRSLSETYHLNAVRICWAYVSDPTLDLATEAQYMDKLVQWAEEDGIYVMLNFHDIGTTNQTKATDFWNFYAPRYKDKTHVFYEANNEPIMWGSDFSPSLITFQQTLYTTIRGHAPNTHIVLWTPSSISNGSSFITNQLQSPNGSGISYTNASVGFHGYGNPSPTLMTQIRNAGYPIVCTEFLSKNETTGDIDWVALLDGIDLYETQAVSWFNWNPQGIPVTQWTLNLRDFNQTFLDMLAAAGIPFWPKDNNLDPTGAPSKATTPSPTNGATAQVLTTTLAWANGGGATSYDVYFGTDSTPDNTELIGNQAGTTYNPGTLTANTTYYWRIDAKNSIGTTTGDVWSFTTAASSPPPSKATTPSPANNATAQLLTATLSWANGGGATSYDVYFGTDSTPDSTELIGNQANTTYNPGTLTAGTTYYWRIDAKNTNGTTTGDVWNFTTLPTPNYYWKFDNTVTATNGGINGTLQNGATYTASGKINQSLDLDGVNDYVSTANIINPSTGNFTVTAWIWLDTVAGTNVQVILQQEGATGRSWLSRNSATGKLNTYLGNTTLSSSGSLTTGQWHFVAVTKSGSTVTLYINGVANGSATRTVESSTGAMRIGAHKTPDSANAYWDGRIDDLRIYTSALTATQISALYNNPGQ